MNAHKCVPRCFQNLFLFRVLEYDIILVNPKIGFGAVESLYSRGANASLLVFRCILHRNSLMFMSGSRWCIYEDRGVIREYDFLTPRPPIFGGQFLFELWEEKMKKSLLSIAIMAALPFGAMAENISGAMYTAPSAADTNHPAPTTQAAAPYGRANIDTADQEHIATTAYVKGAYNSAIAAVNKVDGEKQEVLRNYSYGAPMSTNVIDDEVAFGVAYDYIFGDNDLRREILEDSDGWHAADSFMSAGAVLEVAKGVVDILDDKRVDIYTTWDTNATTQVELSSAQ